MFISFLLFTAPLKHEKKESSTMKKKKIIFLTTNFSIKAKSFSRKIFSRFSDALRERIEKREWTEENKLKIFSEKTRSSIYKISIFIKYFKEFLKREVLVITFNGFNHQMRCVIHSYKYSKTINLEVRIQYKVIACFFGHHLALLCTLVKINLH